MVEVAVVPVPEGLWRARTAFRNALAGLDLVEVEGHPAVTAWTHACCITCFQARHPGKEPRRVPDKARVLEMCCYCWKNTTGGIYDRNNPTDTRCKGHMTPTHSKE